MSNAHLDDLRQQRDAQRARIMDTVQELVGVVVSDVPAFVMREVRRAFVASLAFSERLDDAGLKALKARAADFGAKLGETLAGELAAEGLWIDTSIEGGGGKTLEANEAVWDSLMALATSAEGLLKELGFPEPEEGYGVTYKTPTWFIERSYAPGLIDKYWTQLALLQHLDEEIEEKNKELRRAALESRWDGS